MDSMDIQPYVSSSNPDDLGKLSFKHLTNTNQVRNTISEHANLYFWYIRLKYADFFKIMASFLPGCLRNFEIHIDLFRYEEGGVKNLEKNPT